MPKVPGPPLQAEVFTLIRYSNRFPHLVPLVDFLRARSISFGPESFAKRPKPVNVVVLDIYGESSRPISCLPKQFFGTVKGLADFVDIGIPEHVIMRLYLVEDVTPIVIEILSTALKCSPNVFASHLEHLSGWITTMSIPKPSVMATSWGLTTDRRRLRSSKLRSSHFSVPFRRRVRTEIEWHPGRFRTVYRACEKKREAS